jgi:hypothetical protein
MDVFLGLKPQAESCYPFGIGSAFTTPLRGCNSDLAQYSSTPPLRSPEFEDEDDDDDDENENENEARPRRRNPSRRSPGVSRTEADKS